MTTINLTPETIQAHLDNGARMRSEAIYQAFGSAGTAVAGLFRSAANAMTGDWTNERAV